MFEFDYTLSGIARFNAVKDSAETRATVIGILVGDNLMYEWYRLQLNEILEHASAFDENEYDVRVSMKSGVGCIFKSYGMLTDNRFGVCEDHDVRCIRFWRIKKNGQKPYGDCGRLFKKKAGTFMRELINDSGIQYDANQLEYICTRFAVEWMEARIAQCMSEGIDWWCADANIDDDCPIVSEAAVDIYAHGGGIEDYDPDEHEDIMAEVMVLRSGTMMCGTANGQRVHVEADKPWVFAMHGECDGGTDANVKVFSSRDDAVRHLEKYYDDVLELYHVNKDEIEWDDDNYLGEYRDITITKCNESFSLNKGDYGLDFVYAWIQKAE